jgi:flagellar biosynthetic protein FlhB
MLTILVDGPALPRLFQKIGSEMMAAVAIPFLVLMLAALGGNIIQHRLVWTYETLAPKFSRISPAAGLKRIFSKQSLATLGKGLIKLISIGGVLTMLMWPERERLEALARSDLTGLLPLCLSLTLKLLGSVVAMLAVVAAADYLFQYRQWHERQKMSACELKDGR